MESVGAILEELRQCGMEAAMKNQAPPSRQTPSDGIWCDRCRNTGWIPVEGADGITRMARCPDCYNRRMVVRYLKASGISSSDYERYSMKTFHPWRSDDAMKMKDLAEQFLKNHKKGQGFGVFGHSGAGKTHICIAVCQELTKKYNEPHYYFSYRAEIPELVKASRSYSTDYYEAMEKWKTRPNVYIDDLFKLAGRIEGGRLASIDTDEHRIMFDIINSRYLNHLTTLFSSEYSVNDISKIDEALGSRIYEMVMPYGLGVKGRNQRMGGAWNG